MTLIKQTIIYFLTLVIISSCASNPLETKENTTSEDTNIEVAKQTLINADFQIFELDGRLVRMGNYKGKPYIIALWSTKDTNSIDNLKQLVETKNKYGEKINILALSEEHESKQIQFKNKSKYRFDFYKIKLSKKGKKKALNVLFDAQGHFVAEISPNSYTQIENQINE